MPETGIANKNSGLTYREQKHSEGNILPGCGFEPDEALWILWKCG